MKTKRISFLKGILSAVFMLALMITVFTVMPVTASATNVSEVVYASNLVDGDDIVLTGDTTLYVNADVSLKSISGDYALEIQSDGEHTLTIDNPNGSAIYVKTLKSVKPSQGTVNLTVEGGDSYFAIFTTGDINLDGVMLDVKGDCGIRAYTGNITINGNLFVSVKTYVGVNAPSGSVSIDGDTVSILCAGEGVGGWADAIGAKNDVTLKSNDATLVSYYGISSIEGDISLTGNIAIGAVRLAIVAESGSITMNGSITAQGSDTEKDYFVIYAKEDINFTGSKLDVKGDSGIRAADGNITINGNLSVSVMPLRKEKWRCQECLSCIAHHILREHR